MRSLTALAAIISILSFGPAVYAEEPVVTEGKKVKLNYTLSVDGEVVDTTTDKEPLEYVHGEGSLLPALEQELDGVKQGEHRDITLSAEKGFGKVYEEAVLEVPKDKLPEGDIAVGTVLATQGPDGNPLRGTIKEIKDDSVVLDFNHPLAGKTLRFEIDVLEVV